MTSNNDTYLTPEWVTKPLGHFDLDPCTPEVIFRSIATHRYTPKENGLIQPWFGRVWLNPPYSDVRPWLKRLSEHGNGVALVNAATDTEAFFQYIWWAAEAALFLKGRLRFYTEDGYRSGSNNRDGSVLAGYGKYNAEVLWEKRKDLDGFFVPLATQYLCVVGISASWISVVEIAVSRHGSDEEMKPIYDLVEMIAPDKVQANENWKAKVRQKVQEIRKKRE